MSINQFNQLVAHRVQIYQKRRRIKAEMSKRNIPYSKAAARRFLLQPYTRTVLMVSSVYHPTVQHKDKSKKFGFLKKFLPN